MTAPALKSLSQPPEFPMTLTQHQDLHHLGVNCPAPSPHPARDLVVDPMVLNDIEKEARRLATDVDSLVENLSGVLQSVSGLTVETVQTYRDGVCKTCDEVDSNIRGMYQVGTGDRILGFLLHLILVDG